MQRLASTIRDAFHAPATEAYRITSRAVAVLIAVSVALLLIEIALPLGSPAIRWVLAADRVILVLFALELLLRVGSYVPPQLGIYALGPGQRLRVHVVGRLRYLLRPLVLVDLLTVLGAVPGLRGLRAIRLLRLLRGPRLFRYANPFGSVARALEENSVLYGFGASVFLVTVLLGGLAVFLSERGQNDAIRTLPDAMWWSVVTVTTVGYGDLVPRTGTGRLIGAALMSAGMVTLALFAGIVSSSLVSSVMALRVEAFRMSDIVGHVVVSGYEPGARLLLDALLVEIGPDRRILLFGPTERPADVPPEFQWIQGDPTKESELEKVRLADAEALIVVGSRVELPQMADARTILVVFTARRYLRAYAARRQRPVYVVAEILDSENVDHARTAGADEVVETRRIGFHLLAHAVREHGTATIVGELADIAHHSVHVGPVPAPGRYGDIVGLLLAQHAIAVIGVRDEAGNDYIAPASDLAVGAGWRVLYIATAPLLSPPRRTS